MEAGGEVKRGAVHCRWLMKQRVNTMAYHAGCTCTPRGARTVILFAALSMHTRANNSENGRCDEMQRASKIEVLLLLCKTNAILFLWVVHKTGGDQSWWASWPHQTTSSSCAQHHKGFKTQVQKHIHTLHACGKRLQPSSKLASPGLTG